MRNASDRITIEVTRSPSGWTCQVSVADPRSSSQHTVQVTRADLRRWGTGDDPADLVRRSFEFLLRREPKEAVLRTFDLAVIPRYFPEYERAIREADED